MAELNDGQATTWAAQLAAAAPADFEGMLRQALAGQPDPGETLNRLGMAAFGAGLGEAAADFFRRAVAVAPGVAEYASNLGTVLRALGRVDAAVGSYRAALAIRPDLAAIHSNLGSSLAAAGDPDGAIESLRSAIQLDPALFEAHSNLGNVLVDAGRVDEAVIAYRAAVAVAPDHAEVQWNLGMALLLGGDFGPGWQGFDWRLRCGVRRQFGVPAWDGEALADRTILLHAEQGFGDTLQFIRYAAPVAARGGRVVVECQPELIGLLRQLPHVAEWVPQGQPLPAVDLHCPLLSLPGLFGTTSGTVPPVAGPLQPPRGADLWRRRLGPTDTRRRVGLVWAGHPGHANDRNRSIPIAALEPLAATANAVRFVSLQKGAAAPLPLEAFDAGSLLHDFADTAAVIAHLDLVVTVDTAVAHLAGSMGKPTWVLLPFAADWRWLLGRSDSPWYPAVRLFRQSEPGGWAGVVARVAGELARPRSDGSAPAL